MKPTKNLMKMLSQHQNINCLTCGFFFLKMLFISYALFTRMHSLYMLSVHTKYMLLQCSDTENWCSDFVFRCPCFLVTTSSAFRRFPLHGLLCLVDVSVIHWNERYLSNCEIVSFVIMLYNYPCLNKNVYQLCVLVSFHLRFS